MNRILKRLNKKASFNRIANDINDFIQECEGSGEFNQHQMFQIRAGFIDGLTMEQVKLYADPQFDDEQMLIIRLGFKDGLTMQQVKVYANPKLNWAEMDEIVEALESGLTIEEVKDKHNL